MDFRVKDAENLRTVFATKASATVIEAGDFVALDTGLIIKATAASAKIAYAPQGAGDGETQIEVTVGSDFELVGTADANFAVTDKGAEVDLVVNGGAQQIDLGSSSTDVLLVDISENAGTVGSASDVTVRINPTKVLY